MPAVDAGPQLFHSGVPARWALPDPTNLVLASAWVVALGLIAWPVLSLFLKSLGSDEAGPAFGSYLVFFSSRFFRTAFANSLTVAAIGTITAVVLGFALAAILSQVRLQSAATIRVIAPLAMLSPPFIGAYAWIILGGRSGLVRQAGQAVGVDVPTIYGPLGIGWVSGLNLYPIVFLMVYAAYQRIDRGLLEAATSLGRGWARVFATVTLPLLCPAVMTSATLVFVAILSDFATPSLLGENYPVLATVAFSLFQNEVESDIALSSAVSIVLVLLALALLGGQQAIARRMRHQHEFGEAIAPRSVGRWAQILLAGTCWLVVLVPLVPIVVVVYTSFLETRGPVLLHAFSLDSYRTVLSGSAPAILNSLTFSAVAVLCVTVVGSLVGAVVARRPSAANTVLDAVLMLPYVIPGTVIGIAFAHMFAGPLSALAGTSLTLILVLFVRRLPYTVRASASATQQLERSVEEASISLSATPFRTFRRITFPLIWPGVFAGAVLAFVEIIGELSASLLLYNARTITMPVAVYTQVLGGAYGPAAALSTIMIVFVVAAVWLASRVVTLPWNLAQAPARSGNGASVH